jgi:hypothetical protein
MNAGKSSANGHAASGKPGANQMLVTAQSSAGTRDFLTGALKKLSGINI